MHSSHSSFNCIYFFTSHSLYFLHSGFIKILWDFPKKYFFYALINKHALIYTQAQKVLNILLSDRHTFLFFKAFDRMRVNFYFSLRSDFSAVRSCRSFFYINFLIDSYNSFSYVTMKILAVVCKFLIKNYFSKILTTFELF